MSHGKNIRAIRLCRNYTQKYIAQVLETSLANYSKMENGIIGISPKRLEKIAVTLDVTMAEITCPIQEANTY